VAEITSKFAFYIQRSFLDFGKHCALVHSHPVQFVKDLLLASSADFEPFNGNAGDRTAIEVFCHTEEEKSTRLSQDARVTLLGFDTDNRSQVIRIDSTAKVRFFRANKLQKAVHVELVVELLAPKIKINGTFLQFFQMGEIGDATHRIAVEELEMFLIDPKQDYLPVLVVLTYCRKKESDERIPGPVQKTCRQRVVLYTDKTLQGRRIGIKSGGVGGNQLTQDCRLGFQKLLISEEGWQESKILVAVTAVQENFAGRWTDFDYRANEVLKA
jgi:hypothetical protein